MGIAKARAKSKKYKVTKSAVSVPVKKYVKYQIQKTAEHKSAYWDMNASFATIGSAAWSNINFLAGISTSVDVNRRIGNKIHIDGIEIVGQLIGGQTDSAYDDIFDTVRFVVSLWDSNSAITNPLQTNGVNLCTPITKNNITGTGLIRKYYDKYFTLSASAGTSGGYLPQMKQIKKYVKVNRDIEFTGSTAGSAQEKLLVSCLSDSAGAPNPYFINGYMRMTWTDI